MGKKNRKKKQKRQNKKLVWLEWIAWGVSIWFLFYPYPYQIPRIILLLLPIVGMLLNSQHEPTICSLVTINKNKNAKRKYDLIDFIDLPALVILLRFLIDFEIDSYSLLFVFGTVFLILVVVILFLTHKLIEASNQNRNWLYFVVLSNILAYSYGATGMVNCAFDQSDPMVYEAEVIDKKISSGRRYTTYRIKVNSWGHHLDPENITVPPSQYKKIQIGETVKIDYKKGFLGIPWYYIE